MRRVAVLLGVVLALAGCGSAQKVRNQEGWTQYVVSCGGPFLNFGHCIQKASKVCGGRGYRVLDLEGGEMPASPNTLPQRGGALDIALKVQDTLMNEPEKLDPRKMEGRRLYIRCN